MNSLNQLTNNSVMVLMTSSVDRSLGVSGATLSCSISKDGGAFSGITPSVVDRGLGWYSIALTSGNCDTPGQLVLHVEASGCDTSDRVLNVIANNRPTKLIA